MRRRRAKDLCAGDGCRSGRTRAEREAAFLLRRPATVLRKMRIGCGKQILGHRSCVNYVRSRSGQHIEKPVPASKNRYRRALAGEIAYEGFKLCARGAMMATSAVTDAPPGAPPSFSGGSGNRLFCRYSATSRCDGGESVKRT